MRTTTTLFILFAVLAACAVAAPQQQRQQQQQQSSEEEADATTTTTTTTTPVRRQPLPAAEGRKPISDPDATSSEEDRKPVAIHRPETSSVQPSADSDPSTDVRREEHKKIVPFQFHRVCRELDLKRQNCSCVWESTFQDGLDVASEKTRECKKDTEEEVHECLKGFDGYEQCLANPAFEHHRPSLLSDDLLSKKCQDFNLSESLCTCLKDRDGNGELKTALHACKDEARKTEADSGSKSKRQADKTDDLPEEISEHSQVRAIPPPLQHQINKECVVAALNAHCNASTTTTNNNNNGAKNNN